jgi:O-methyltransferase/methyltransferase family protein
MADPTTTTVQHDTIDRLRLAADQAHAMLAGVKLQVFTHLADGPLTSAQLAGQMDVQEGRLARLLYALAVTGLLEVRGGRFANTPEAATFLVKGRQEYVGGFLEEGMQEFVWRADLLTADSIRSGQAAALHDFNNVPDDEMAVMIRGMHGGSAAVGRALAARFDFTECRSIVDVGGGSGGLVASLCEAYPDLRGTLFELPRTCQLAAPILKACPGGSRVTVEEGDILAASPRGMHDAALLKSVLQCFSPLEAARAVANTAAAVCPGGALYLIVGVGILNDDRVSPPDPVFRNITLMNTYPEAAAYTETEHVAWLSAAGCGPVERVRLSTGYDLLRAIKQP